MKQTLRLRSSTNPPSKIEDTEKIVRIVESCKTVQQLLNFNKVIHNMDMESDENFIMVRNLICKKHSEIMTYQTQTTPIKN